VLTPAQTALIDEFGELYRENQAWAPKEKRLEALRQIIRSWYPDLAADRTEVAYGTLYELQIGEKPIEKTWVSMAAVYKAAGGLKAFLKICTVTFKALSGVLGNPAAEALQIEERTGQRKLKAVARVIELPKAA
jgi:hypothetical protein